MIQIIRVLVTSTIDLTREDIFFVTVTPEKLKKAIETNPIITKAIRVPLLAAYEK